MPKCTREWVRFPGFERRVIETRFSGGDITSDGGVLLLREADRVLGLTEKDSGGNGRQAAAKELPA